MSPVKFIVYGLLGITILLGVVFAFWTVIPDASASTNFMGGKTHCPFVPYSTIGSVVVAAIGLVLFFVARRFWR